ncbi:uncharacterized protein [Drosophila suzukii]|uniref:DUF4780 domain-containing protein n=1 Tax=Drosophila suzukii TaxID=28584 RepID=A0ABM4TXG0_DROSZ
MEPGTPKKPVTEEKMGATGSASVGSACAGTSSGAIPKGPHPKLGVIGGRQSAASTSAKCAPAPKTAGGMTKTVAPTTEQNKHTYAEKRTAAQTLRSHNRSKIANPSAEWLKKVEWAKTVLPNYGQEKPNAVSTQPKRQRSLELPGPAAKRTRVQQNLSFAEIARDKVMIGLVDKGNPGGRIPRNQWKAVEEQLAVICMALLRDFPQPTPCCKDAGWFQGSVKVVSCDSQRSADLYKKATEKLGKVYPGAKIVALDWCDVPSRPRARIWLPSSIKTPEDILFMLQRCNPNLPTHDWKVVKVEPHEGPISQAIVVLNKESVSPIEAAHGELNFGFSAIRIKVYKGDSNSKEDPTGNPAEQVFPEEIEAPGDDEPEDGYSTDASLSRGM